jgi:hypothetical protein
MTHSPHVGGLVGRHAYWTLVANIQHIVNMFVGNTPVS